MITTSGPAGSEVRTLVARNEAFALCAGIIRKTSAISLSNPALSSSPDEARAVQLCDHRKPAAQFALDMGFDHLRGEVLRRDVRLRIGMNAEEAAIPGFADERRVWVDGSGGETEPEPANRAALSLSASARSASKPS